MAKRAGFTQTELGALDKMSIDQLDKMILSIRGQEANGASNANGTGGIKPQLGLDKQSDLAKQDLFESQKAIQNDDSLDAIALRNFDPATLEEVPAYANGSSPDRPLNRAPDGASWERFKLSFSNKSMPDRIKYLEESYGKDNVKATKNNNLTVKRDDGKWYQLDPIGMGEGAWHEKALEATRDVLADNADIALSIGATVATAGAGAPLMAGLTGARAVGMAAALGAQQGIISGASKVVMGRLVGTYDSTPEQMAKDVGVEMLFGMGGNAFIPGVKYGAKEFGRMFAKTGAVIEKTASPGVKEALPKALAFTSGQPLEITDQWVNNGVKVGQQAAKYGEDSAGALLQSVQDTKTLAHAVIKARNAMGDKIYGDFAKEAGKDFTPFVGRMFNTADVATDIPLLGKGILKWDGIKGELALNSIDDITKADPINLFKDPMNRRVIKPVLDIVNDFNKLPIQSGEAGAKNFILFQQKLGAAVRQAEAIALAPGRNMGEALMEVKALKAQLQTQWVNKAVDASKAPELAAKLTGVNKQWAMMKEQIAPFEDAVRKGMKDKSLDPYRALFDQTINSSKINSKNAVMKDQLKQTIEMMTPYSKGVDLADIVDTMGARKAALASVPWSRGGLDNAFATGAIASGNVAAMTAAAVRSPRISYKVSQLANSSYKGLETLRSFTPPMKQAMLTSKEAIDKYFGTILNAPSIETQTALQLQQMLQGGGQNGQQ